MQRAGHLSGPSCSAVMTRPSHPVCLVSGLDAESEEEKTLTDHIYRRVPRPEAAKSHGVKDVSKGWDRSRCISSYPAYHG